MARAHSGGMAVSSVPKAEVAAMCQYQTCGKRVMVEGLCGTFAISSDGIRCGDPPEETLVLVLWSEKKDLSLVLPPQVCQTRQGYTLRARVASQESGSDGG